MPPAPEPVYLDIVSGLTLYPDMCSFTPFPNMECYVTWRWITNPNFPSPGSGYTGYAYLLSHSDPSFSKVASMAVMAPTAYVSPSFGIPMSAVASDLYIRTFIKRLDGSVTPDYIIELGDVF